MNTSVAQVLPVPFPGKVEFNHLRQETKTQRGEEAGLRPHSKLVPELSLEQKLCSVIQGNHRKEGCLGKGTGSSSVACACVCVHHACIHVYVWVARG